MECNKKPQPHPNYSSNVEETDTRLWLHVKNTTCRHILVLSPDTDIYHIGLPLSLENKQILTQVSPLKAKDVKLIDLQALIKALRHDPDLVGVAPDSIPKIMQTLFVCTGCDYVSFFNGLGKGTFMCYFFQYASFITGTGSEGSLANNSFKDNDYENGFLSFLRLVGTVYFKKHSTGFDTHSPASHFLNFTTIQYIAQHKQWLSDIRENISDRAMYDTGMIPSTEALFYHWKRTCWILNMWGQADQNNIVLEPISNYGWNVESETLSVQWDTEENMQMVRERVNVLLRGCKCVTGCTTRACGCRKKDKKCTVGCQCTNSMNHEMVATNEDSELAILALEEDVTTADCSDVDDEFYLLPKIINPLHNLTPHSICILFHLLQYDSPLHKMILNCHNEVSTQNNKRYSIYCRL